MIALLDIYATLLGVNGKSTFSWILWILADASPSKSHTDDDNPTCYNVSTLSALSAFIVHTHREREWDTFYALLFIIHWDKLYSVDQISRRSTGHTNDIKYQNQRLAGEYKNIFRFVMDFSESPTIFALFVPVRLFIY